MKVIVNRRTSLRRHQKRHGPKPKTFMTQLRMLPDQRLVVDFPGSTKKLLVKGVGGRVWFYAEDQGLHITAHPWGPYAGRHRSTRIRTTHVSIRRCKRCCVGPPRLRRRSSRE